MRVYAHPSAGTIPRCSCFPPKRSIGITFFKSISIAGFAATAISFGPARMGFGLFVPEFRSAFSMSTTTIGIVSSLAFLGFLVGLVIAQVLLGRTGPMAPVVSGLAAATLGIVAVALAPNVYVLALGVFIAASSAGFDWTPFNDAVNRSVREVDKPASLSVISSGTSVGIFLAGVAALVMQLSGLSWRLCWAFFAVASLVALYVNRAALRWVGKSAQGIPEAVWRILINRAALPLFATAFVFGVSSAVYISFAADRVREAGGVPGLPASAAPAVIFIAYGAFGLFGLMTGRAKEAVGLAWLLRGLMWAGALSLALVALAPTVWLAVVVSGGLQGIHVMMISALMAFWSQRMFPSLPSLGFTSALLAMALGSVIGPAIAGVASDRFGPEAMFLATAALVGAAACAFLRRFAQERPIDGYARTEVRSVS